MTLSPATKAKTASRPYHCYVNGKTKKFETLEPATVFCENVFQQTGAVLGIAYQPKKPKAPKPSVDPYDIAIARVYKSEFEHSAAGSMAVLAYPCRPATYQPGLAEMWTRIDGHTSCDLVRLIVQTRPATDEEAQEAVKRMLANLPEWEQIPPVIRRRVPSNWYQLQKKEIDRMEKNG